MWLLTLAQAYEVAVLGDHYPTRLRGVAQLRRVVESLVRTASRCGAGVANCRAGVGCVCRRVGQVWDGCSAVISSDLLPTATREEGEAETKYGSWNSSNSHISIIGGW